MTVEVKHGYFGYTKNSEILRDISFVLGEQEIMTILGPNGIGKTTLLKCMTGILQWTRGQTLINGTPIGTSREAQKQYPIGYVPQAHSLFFSLYCQGSGNHGPGSSYRRLFRALQA
jgi:iron complex transport system ATP-binding protein